MIFIQMFYWSTNQTITQRAMAAPTLKEGQKGVLAAAVIRLIFIPAIVVVPGVVAFKLFGDVGDATYGKLVALVMPGWLSGAFAAFMAAAVGRLTGKAGVALVTSRVSCRVSLDRPVYSASPEASMTR